MTSFRPRIWLVDHVVWFRHRLSTWLLLRARAGASGWMALLLTVPLWICLLGATIAVLILAFDGSSARLFVLVPALIAFAVLFEGLCAWWRVLVSPLEHVEALQLLELLNQHVDTTDWKTGPWPGPWCPSKEVEKWMVHWAFGEEHVRRAQAARMQNKTPSSAGKKESIRL